MVRRLLRAERVWAFMLIWGWVRVESCEPRGSLARSLARVRCDNFLDGLVVALASAHARNIWSRGIGLVGSMGRLLGLLDLSIAWSYVFSVYRVFIDIILRGIWDRRANGLRCFSLDIFYSDPSRLMSWDNVLLKLADWLKNLTIVIEIHTLLHLSAETLEECGSNEWRVQYTNVSRLLIYSNIGC